MPAQRSLLDGDTGQKFDSLELLAGAVAGGGGGGGGLLQSSWVQPLAPGEAQDITTASQTDVLDGTGTATRMQALLPNAVLADSSFRLFFGMSAVPIALAGSAVPEIAFRGRLFSPDDPNLPANYPVFLPLFGLTLSTTLFTTGTAYFQSVVTQSMISTITVGNGPVVGRLGLWLEAFLQDGAPGDVVRLNLFPGTGAQRNFLAIEEWGPALVAA